MIQIFPRYVHCQPQKNDRTNITNVILVRKWYMLVLRFTKTTKYICISYQERNIFLKISKSNFYLHILFTGIKGKVYKNLFIIHFYRSMIRSRSLANWLFMLEGLYCVQHSFATKDFIDTMNSRMLNWIFSFRHFRPLLA